MASGNASRELFDTFKICNAANLGVDCKIMLPSSIQKVQCRRLPGDMLRQPIEFVVLQNECSQGGGEYIGDAAAQLVETKDGRIEV
jgi:hypothetical protein